MNRYHKNPHPLQVRGLAMADTIRDLQDMGVTKTELLTRAASFYGVKPKSVERCALRHGIKL